MYVGSVESVRQNMWIYDTETDRLITKGKNFKLVAFFKVDLSHFVVINDFLKNILEIDFIPALYKIYDEIIVNAADNKVRDPNQTLIKVDISKVRTLYESYCLTNTVWFIHCKSKITKIPFQENNEIAIMNNGRGIPIEIHKEHNVHIPSMIFGEMMTSSNYDDDEKKVTGGRNGFGAKLCNIFSESFTGKDNR